MGKQGGGEGGQMGSCPTQHTRARASYAVFYSKV